MAEKVCPECRYERPTYTGPGKEITLPGMVHHRSCPTLPFPTDEEADQLRRDLAEIADCERRAWEAARHIVIGRC